MRLIFLPVAFTVIVSFSISVNAQQAAAPKQSPLHSQPHATVKRFIQEALAAEESGEFILAIEKNMEVLQLDPQNIAAMNTIAGLYGKVGEFDQEVVWAKKAIAINPQFDLAYINYGNGLAGLQKFSEAKEAFNKAAQIAPTSPLGVYSLGVVAEQQGDFRQATTLYQKSVQIDPKFENGYFNLATAHANINRFDDAIAALKRLLEINPNATDAKAMLAQIEKAKRQR